MTTRARSSQANRPALVVALVAGISLAVLGWFGGRSLLQERRLSRLLLADRLDQTAPLILRELDAELERWEGHAAVEDRRDALPPMATRLEFTAQGVTAVRGERLPYYPAVVPVEVPPDDRLIRAQQAEFDKADFAAAIAGYTEAAGSTGRTVRATALAALGRCLRQQGRIREAFAAYDELAGIDDAWLGVVPAKLVAHRERQALYTSLGDAASAERERASIAADLLARRYIIDRPTYDGFAQALSSDRPPATVLARAEAVIGLWPRMQNTSGRTVSGAGETAFAVVWRSAEGRSAAVVAAVSVLMTSSAAIANQLATSIAVEQPDGQVVWTEAAPGEPTAVLPLQIIGLPLTLRVSPSGADSHANPREPIVIGAFLLLAAVVTIAAAIVLRRGPRESFLG